MEALNDLNPANMGAVGRARCLPGTRVQVLVDLFLALTHPNPENKIIWLHGPTGSGKSTILNTLARCLRKLDRQGAFLFFDQNDRDNSDPCRVISTLAHQLARFHPIFAEKILSQIQTWPGITESSLDAQFRRLIQDPLTAIAKTDDWGPIIIVLDALDECGTTVSRKPLLKALLNLTKLPKMFRLLIASRDEPKTTPSLDTKRLSIPVDNGKSSDIELFRSALADVATYPIKVRSALSDINLLFRRWLSRNADVFVNLGLPPDWPGGHIIEQLVAQSEGLFSWASTAIRFIESDFPEERLKAVLIASAHGMSRIGLDDLYQVVLTHQFSSYNASELKVAHSILGAIVVSGKRLSDQQLSRLLGVAVGKVQDVLFRLHPVLRWARGRPVQLLHSSFTDFLCDPTRCQDPQWRININVSAPDLASTSQRAAIYGRENMEFDSFGPQPTVDVRNSHIPHSGLFH